MKRRKSKKTDQQQAQIAFEILKETMAEHTEIEPTLWASAFWSCLVDGYINSGITYEEFCNEWDILKKHYKKWFDDEE